MVSEKFLLGHSHLQTQRSPTARGCLPARWPCSGPACSRDFNLCSGPSPAAASLGKLGRPMSHLRQSVSLALGAGGCAPLSDLQLSFASQTLKARQGQRTRSSRLAAGTPHCWAPLTVGPPACMCTTWGPAPISAPLHKLRPLSQACAWTRETLLRPCRGAPFWWLLVLPSSLQPFTYLYYILCALSDLSSAPAPAPAPRWSVLCSVSSPKSPGRRRAWLMPVGPGEWGLMDGTESGGGGWECRVQCRWTDPWLRWWDVLLTPHFTCGEWLSVV